MPQARRHNDRARIWCRAAARVPALPAAACRRLSSAKTMTRALTGIAFPQFWFSQLTRRRSPARRAAVPEDGTTTGLHAVITADLNILTAVLTLDRSWRSEPGPPGAAGMTHPAPTARPEGRRR